MNELTFKYDHTSEEGEVFGEIWFDNRKLSLASFVIGNFYGALDGKEVIFNSDDLREQIKDIVGQEFILKVEYGEPRH